MNNKVYRAIGKPKIENSQCFSILSISYWLLNQCAVWIRNICMDKIWFIYFSPDITYFTSSYSNKNSSYEYIWLYFSNHIIIICSM